MKKTILTGVLATGLVMSVGLASSAYAASDEVKGQNKITVVGTANGETVSPYKVKSLFKAAKLAWKSIPAMDRFSVTQALWGGGVQKSDDLDIDKKDLEYLFDK